MIVIINNVIIIITDQFASLVTFSYIAFSSDVIFNYDLLKHSEVRRNFNASISFNTKFVPTIACENGKGI